MATMGDEEQRLDLDQFLAQYLSDFRPLAYYDKHMDCIRVRILDCSVTEERINRIFTVLRPNHGDLDNIPCVGFTIKGVRHLFEELGLPFQGVLLLSKIIDEIVKKFPAATVKNFTEPLIGRDEIMNLEVNLNEADPEQGPERRAA